MSLTKTLGRFVADLSPNKLPEDAARIARLGFIDCIGTMIAGRREDCVRIMKQEQPPGSTARRHTRWTTMTLACAATPARCWSPRSSRRPRRLGPPEPT
jgi:2-methylcitrate dehydratase PrpD